MRGGLGRARVGVRGACPAFKIFILTLVFHTEPNKLHTLSCDDRCCDID